MSAFCCPMCRKRTYLIEAVGWDADKQAPLYACPECAEEYRALMDTPQTAAWPLWLRVVG